MSRLPELPTTLTAEGKLDKLISLVEQAIAEMKTFNIAVQELADKANKPIYITNNLSPQESPSWPNSAEEFYKAFGTKVKMAESKEEQLKRYGFWRSEESAKEILADIKAQANIELGRSTLVEPATMSSDAFKNINSKVLDET